MSLTGNWNLSVVTPMGDQKLELELVQTGADQISGVTRSDSEADQPLVDPVLKGNQLTWKLTMTKPMKITANMDLVFDGDAVQGTAKAGMFPAAKVTGHRAS